MFIPVIEEIDIPNINWGHAKITLDNISLGDHPFILRIKHIHQVEELKVFLHKFHDYLTEKGLSPKLPYPIFIKTHLKLKSDIFTIVDDQYINNYYLKKSYSIKSKESAILKKILILKDGFINHKFEQAEYVIKDHSNKSRMLKNLCYEKNFYKSIIATWES
jgi:hypothetical protein